MVVSRARGDSLGLVMAQHANFQDGYAYIGALGFHTRDRVPQMVFGFAIFIEYLFTCWPLRKLYLEVPEYNVAQFGSGIGTYLDIEARLRDHVFYAGRHWDFLTLALYRDKWAERGSRLLEPELRTPKRVRVTLPASLQRPSR